MTHADSLIQAAIQQSVDVQTRLGREHAGAIRQIAERLSGVLRRGGTIYLCGNGGSAADAQHVAAELVGRFLRERRPLPAVALTTNTSILTSIGNDFDFSEVFVRQVRAQVADRDAVVGISTSGKAKNVLLAVDAARQLGAATIAFTGSPGEPLASRVDLSLRVPSAQTPRIQEAHILVWHVVCDLVEQAVVDAA